MLCTGKCLLCLPARRNVVAQKQAAQQALDAQQMTGADAQAAQETLDNAVQYLEEAQEQEQVGG